MNSIQLCSSASGIRRGKSRGQTLVGLLVVLAIMALLGVALMKGSGMFGVPGKSVSGRKDGKGTTVMGSAEWAARDTVCRSDLAQVRAALQIAETPDGEHPATLQELKLGAEFYKCPVGGEAYVYDPATGTVHCPHPGHENY
jgi:hypothetical protein